MKPVLASLVILAALAVPSLAQAACDGRVRIGSGETVSSIARKCGVNVETLKRANPGITDNNFQRGTYLNVPPVALPSPSANQPRPPIGQGIVIPGIEKIKPKL
jgi:LysM repeat protein